MLLFFYIIGDKKEIREVKNAYDAYEEIDKINPYSIKDLCRIHGVMTNLIVKNSGNFRKNAEGVFEGNKCIFMALPPEVVNELMNQLFNWLKKSKDKLNPLILSSVFHYEFLFIHPFTDGNVRMARLWQNTILSKWKPIFKYVPIETQIKKYQDDYYNAIGICHRKGTSDKFIEFMLKMIDETLEELLKSTRVQINHISKYITKLLNVMEKDIPMSANEIMEKLQLKSKETFRKNYINPAIKEGLINLTIPDKPTSKNQRYYRL